MTIWSGDSPRWPRPERRELRSRRECSHINNRVWTQQPAGQSVWDGDAPPFVASFVLHLAIILALGLWPLAAEKTPNTIVVSSTPFEDEVELKLPEAFASSEISSQEVGANSVQGSLMAMSAAPIISDVSLIPNRLDAVPVENAKIEINNILESTGLHYVKICGEERCRRDRRCRGHRPHHARDSPLHGRAPDARRLDVRPDGQFDSPAANDSRSLCQDLPGTGRR
jgi:hypothetical protein